tara:strand:+ start:374 stop:676 length:303 start_codon:yes stop_codon:yes gene_type:complete
MKLLFYLYLFLNSNIGKHSEIKTTVDNYKLGYDFRKIEEDDIILKIKKNLYKKQLLEKLENPNTSLITKLNIIEKTDIFEKKYIDLLSGGLLDDYNFTFD